MRIYRPSGKHRLQFGQRFASGSAKLRLSYVDAVFGSLSSACCGNVFAWLSDCGMVESKLRLEIAGTIVVLDLIS